MKNSFTKENFAWQIPFLFLIFVSPLSTSLSELTKGIFLLFLLFAFFFKERRKIIIEKFKKNSFLFKIVIIFFIVHLIGNLIAGKSIGYWGNSKIGIINHSFGVFVPHVIIFFYSYFFLKIDFFKKIFIPFLILIIAITLYSLINFWSGKTNLPLGIYGKLTTHSRLIAIFFSIVVSIVIFSIVKSNLISWKEKDREKIKKYLNPKNIMLFLLMSLSLILLILEFRNSFSRSLFICLITATAFFTLYFLRWQKILILLPFFVIFFFFVTPKKIKEKIYMNISFYLKEKSDNSIQKITFPNSSQVKISFKKSLNAKRILVKYYDEKSFFEKEISVKKNQDFFIMKNQNINTNSFFTSIEIHQEQWVELIDFNYHQQQIKILERIKKRELHKGDSEHMKLALKLFLQFNTKKLQITFLQRERKILWNSAWNTIKKKIFTGFGFRSWHHFSHQIEWNDFAYPYRYKIDTRHYYVHNNFLDLWYGSGFLSFLVFIVFIFLFFITFFYQFFIKKEGINTFEKKILFIALLLFAQLNLLGFFDITIFVTSPIGSFYWFFVALLLQNFKNKIKKTIK